MISDLTISTTGALPGDLEPLVRASRTEGFRFLERLCDDWASGANRFDAVGEAFFEARSRGSLVGVCGLNRDPHAGSPQIGRLRRLYVAAPLRGRGVGRALVHAALAHACEQFVAVRVRTDTSEGDRFYRALGFSPSSIGNASHEYPLPERSSA